MIEAAGSQLSTILRACEWSLIDELPDEVEIWRGARGCTVEQAGRGLCWTLDKDVAAAWTFMLRALWEVKGNPIVIRRMVPKSAIAMIHIPGNLAEVVIEAEPGVDLDGNLSDWTTGANRYFDMMVAAGVISLSQDLEIAQDATVRAMKSWGNGRYGYA